MFISKYLIGTGNRLLYTDGTDSPWISEEAPVSTAADSANIVILKKYGGSSLSGAGYCLPFKKGCDYCTRGIREEYSGFKELKTIAEETLANLQGKSGDLERITISGGGDPSCYPRFTELIELLGSMEAPLHIGYTSGKGWDDPAVADLLIDNGLSELSFTVFATDPALRKRWMHDPTPEVSLSILEKLCGNVDVYAAAVILPGYSRALRREHRSDSRKSNGGHRAGDEGMCRGPNPWPSPGRAMPDFHQAASACDHRIGEPVQTRRAPRAVHPRT